MRVVGQVQSLCSGVVRKLSQGGLLLLKLIIFCYRYRLLELDVQERMCCPTPATYFSTDIKLRGTGVKIPPLPLWHLPACDIGLSGEGLGGMKAEKLRPIFK